MKKSIFIIALLTAIIVYSACFYKHNTIAPEKEIAQTLVTQVDSFAAAKNKLLMAVQTGASEAQLQTLFLQTRIAYKKFEWAAEYFAPTTSRFVNGPPVQEIETDGQVIEPAGLQVIEALLFPKYDTTQKKRLIQQLTMLQAGCDKYTIYFGNIGIFDWQVFDAAKLEMFRIETLGITGFDDPLSLKSMQESAACVESLQKVMSYYGDEKDTMDLSGKFDVANRYLSENADFNSFNRAAFILIYANPITARITDLEKKLQIHVITYNRLLRQDARTLFDSNAFNANAYAPDTAYYMSDKKIALGKMLFADPILSTTGTRSCQTCHQPDKAFTDGLAKNTIINSAALLPRNTPTLLNAALQPSQFYDLRATTLEDQSLAVIQNEKEMHGSMQVAVDRLWHNKKYRELFAAAFPVTNRAGIDTFEVMNAIGSYVRSLVLLNSRFDAYMRGDKTAMNEEEVNGFNLFMGKAKCGTCHYMPLFNGTFPPRYVKIETEVIGVPQAIGKNVIDNDMGRYAIVKVESQKHAFKTLTVRNAAKTAPYMHNGVFTTLAQVLDFYNKGGGAGLGLKIDNQTLPFDKLDLTAKESGEIIAFIKSLDSQ
ncbi:MAG TPA: cytochrome c peroxidase [Ferruginibacter sp.]|jgi:cytochrome c peroxidase|nr:cytochrome c peroxidase [Ferruginibacter sp.]